MKFCPICEIEKQRSEFYKHKATRDGLNTYCKSCTIEKTAKYQKENPEKVNKKNRKWGARNRDKTARYTRQFRERNPGVAYKYTKKALSKRPGLSAFYATKRHAEKLLRTPQWANLDAIKFFYECCPKGCHVDHVIPLRGELISGLHIETNLQWLPARKNLRKSNSWTPE